MIEILLIEGLREFFFYDGGKKWWNEKIKKRDFFREGKGRKLEYEKNGKIKEKRDYFWEKKEEIKNF